MFNLSDAIKDHFYHPRNVGVIVSPTEHVYVAKVNTTDHSTIMQLSITLDRDNRIAEARFKTYGCPSAIAVSSFITELVLGKTKEQIKTLTSQELITQLGLSSDKYYCALLGEDLIREIALMIMV